VVEAHGAFGKFARKMVKVLSVQAAETGIDSLQAFRRRCYNTISVALQRGNAYLIRGGIQYVLEEMHPSVVRLAVG
jgi:hypothetical protein